MKILTFAQQNHSINFYRIWQPCKTLQTLGHEVVYSPHRELEPFGYYSNAQTFEDGTYHPRWILNNCERTDLIWATLPQNPVQLATLEGFREGLNAPLAIDIDDLMSDIPAYNDASKVLSPKSDRLKISKLSLEKADFITTTCPFLADKVRQFNPHVTIIKNCVDPSMWAGERPIKHDGKVRVIWAGSGPRFADALSIKEVMMWMHDKYRDKVKLIFVGACPDFGVEWVEEGFAYVTQWAQIPHYMSVMRYVAPDIGLAPLVSNDFNRSKSNLKYLDHAMMGAAGIYADECTYESVADGVTGIKVRTPEDWKFALKRLIENPGFRASIAAASRADVMKRFNIETYATALEHTLVEATSAAKANSSFLKKTLADTFHQAINVSGHSNLLSFDRSNPS